MTPDNVGDQGCVGESHSFEGLGVLKKKSFNIPFFDVVEKRERKTDEDLRVWGRQHR